MADTQDTTAEIETEDTETDDAQTTTETPPESGGERMFSESQMQEIVNAAVEKRLARERSKTKKPPKPAAKKQEPEQPAFDAEQFQARLEAKFERRDAYRELKLSPKQQKTIELLWEAESPDGDAGSWAREQAKELGFFAEEPAKAETTVPAAKTPPAFDAGAPSTAPASYNDSDDPLTWSRDHINRILADKGTREGRKYIRRRLEQAMENVRIVLPR